MCGKPYLYYDVGILPIEGLDGEGYICNHCYNRHMADMLEIKNLDDFISEYTCTDVDGKEHEFQIRRWINTTGVLWQAFEVFEDGLLGYRFDIEAGLHDDQNEALQKLYNKIQKGLLRKYIKEKVINEKKTPMLAGNIVEGRIEQDEEYGGDILIIDGKKYTWEDLGKMVLWNEGLNFKLQIFNPEYDMD